MHTKLLSTFAGLFIGLIAAGSTPTAAAPLTFQRQITVEGTGVPCAGERDNCSRSGEITIVIPAKYKLTAWIAEVRDDRNPTWVTEANDLGWAAWEVKSVTPQADGSVIIYVKLRSWVHDRLRFVRVLAMVE